MEVLEEALTTIEVLRSMHEPMDEFHILQPSNLSNLLPLDTDALSQIRDRDGGQVELCIDIRNSSISDTDTRNTICLMITIPLSEEHRRSGFSLSVRHETWMSREVHARLQRVCVGDGVDGLDWSEMALNAIQALRDEQIELLKEMQDQDIDTEQRSKETTAQTQDAEPLQRCWFLLISLSTPSKRDELVAWAPQYNLSGFVLAGKPGLVCLEGARKDIDAYMSEIKSVSWADVPSHQKKISLVLTETIGTRKFSDMSEITDLFSMHGKRGNRADLGQVREWMESKGVGKLFGMVFMGSGSGA
ncbi:hypothetical protein HDU77_006105 [Chytriomyces hyalinus]|nr:hypothetical protein HDU77_006105 [Chytriomyces hyalinus]